MPACSNNPPIDSCICDSEPWRPPGAALAPIPLEETRRIICCMAAGSPNFLKRDPNLRYIKSKFSTWRVVLPLPLAKRLIREAALLSAKHAPNPKMEPSEMGSSI